MTKHVQRPPHGLMMYIKSDFKIMDLGGIILPPRMDIQIITVKTTLRHLLFFFTDVRGTCRKQFFLFWLPGAVDFERCPAHRYRAVPSPVFEPTTLWLRVRRPNHSATTLHEALSVCIHPQNHHAVIHDMTLQSIQHQHLHSKILYRPTGHAFHHMNRMNSIQAWWRQWFDMWK
jgi:hypothetical protein